jgi:hypothetical protein
MILLRRITIMGITIRFATTGAIIIIGTTGTVIIFTGRGGLRNARFTAPSR